jgi:hypothetical protein
MTPYSEEPPRRPGLLEFGARLDPGSDGGGGGTGETIGVGMRRTGVSPGSGTRIDSNGVMGCATGVCRTPVRGASGGGEGLTPTPPPPAVTERARLNSRQHVGQRHSTTSDPSGPW